MSINGELLEHLRQGVNDLLEADQFENGSELRPTQREALLSYRIHLESPDISDEEKLTGYFEIPTGIGKTAIFSGISGAVNALAAAEKKNLRTAIIVPSITLLHQTEEALEEYSPSLKGKIGLYGGDGKDRDLSKPISIITYNSWLKLMESGELHSEKIDLLISDEAHRGTSVRQLANLFNSFDARTARLAFTATAHFDKTKSVQQTHHNEIFYKSIGDGVRGGELAAYIQTQMHIIRATPSDEMRLKFQKEADRPKIDSAYRRMVRQAAWNKAAVSFYREGIDQHTGDPLSDNQAGFFTAGIPQANQLEKLLNSDSTLAQKSAKNGYQAVAVVIHSKLSIPEQKKRLEAYKNGEYMAAIGDEKFKEGFDHPPMKTIIDYPHASLVDKAQIIGRGTRQWFNPLKDGRAEGLTFVDTIVYYGSDDPEKDKKQRDEALQKAVTSWEILQGTFVLSPHGPSSKGNGGTTKAMPIFEEVESYSTTDEVNTLFAERKKLRKEDWIEISDDLRKELSAELERSDITPHKLLRSAKTPPRGLNGAVISGWLGASKMANPDHVNWVLDELKDRPSYFKFTPEFIALLQEKVKERDSSSRGMHHIGRDMDIPRNILSQTCGLDYKDLKRNISEFFTGNIKQASMPEFLVRWAYATLSDMPLIDQKMVPVDSKQKEQFKQLLSLESVSATGFARMISTFPGKLSYNKFKNLLLGKVDEIEKGYLDWSLNQLKSYETPVNKPFHKNFEGYTEKQIKRWHEDQEDKKHQVFYDAVSEKLSREIPGFLSFREVNIWSHRMTKEERDKYACRNYPNYYKPGDLENNDPDDEWEYIIPATIMRIGIGPESSPDLSHDDDLNSEKSAPKSGNDDFNSGPS